jgi:peptide/nickel transport system permease protein
MVYLSFLLPRLLPGDFVTAMYSSSDVVLTAGQEAELKAYYAREESFGRYVKDLACFRLGYSYAFQKPITGLIMEALLWTLLLLGSAQIAALSIGFFIGVESGWRRGKRQDKILVGIMAVLEGFPEIATGVVLLFVFSFQLGWFPSAAAETAYAQVSVWERAGDIGRHMVLPWVTLFISFLPGNYLLMRNSMVMVIPEPYIRTAQAKGLAARRIRYAHAARTALLPFVTRFGLRLSLMVTGAVVVETIFSYPGIGTLLYNAIEMRDMPLVRGIVLIVSLLVLGINFALEFIYKIIDPRIEHAG